MLSQQRAIPPVGKQGNKSSSAIASTSIPTIINIPPALTENALSTLCRLPISTDSTLNWQRYNLGPTKDNSKDVKAIHEALLQLSFAESKDFGTSSSLPLLQSTLWAIERDTSNEIDVITSIWLFNLQGKDKVAESSNAASSEKRRRAIGCKEQVEHQLSPFKTTREQGTCQLQEFYTPFTSASYEDTLLLVPSSNHARLLGHFIKALNEHFLTNWVWSGSQDQHNQQMEEQIEEHHSATPSSANQDSRRKSHSKEEVERDEEEEGAIRDGVTGSSGPTIKLEYWPKSYRRSSRKVTRFGNGIVVQPLTHSSTLFDKSHTRDRQAVCFTLRCFVDEQGHIYLETRPTRANGMQHIEDSDVNNHQALLAPDGMQAVLIERIKDLSWSDKGNRHGDEENEKQALECRQKLLTMLQVRGVDIERLEDDWILCETEERGRFLWPTKLCFIMASEEEKQQISIDGSSLPIFLKPLLDIAERAKGLVKESIGMRNVVGNGDAMMLDVEDQQDEGIKEEEDEGTDADAEDQEDDEEGLNKKKDVGMNERANNIEDVAGAILKTESKSKEVSGSLQGSSHIPVEEYKPIVSTKEEEETDLWGTFGFGLPNNDSKDLDRRQSLTGLDEGGFGLITEDDFDFFDEAAQGVGAFDDMDVDLDHQEITNARGDTTFQSLDTDNGSDLAMTNSTFLDPPSLPGFTPGSLSGTSENDAKALGGLNAKTPRTPFSPSQDLIDAHISIEGEADPLFHDPRRFHSHHQDSSFDHMNVGMIEPRQNEKMDSIDEENQTLNPQNREHLMSKYEEGKFALPRVPTRKRGDTEEVVEVVGRSEREVYSRNRLRHRVQSARRMSGGRSLLSRKSKASHLSLRGEEDLSDLEATVDGTISDRSSLINEDSDDEMTSDSEDTSEEEGARLEGQLNLLQSSIEALQGLPLPLPKQKTSPALQEVTDIDPIKDAKIAKSLKRLTYNPQVRLCVCPVQADRNETLLRSLAKELFTPLPNTAEENNLGALLSRTDLKRKEKQETSIHLLESPKIMVGCQGAIASMESTALSFWEKLGLSAVSGPKNVAAMALHCGCLPTSWQKELLDWMSAFNDTFKRNGFGQQMFADDALLALGESHHTSISQLLVQTSKHAEQWTDTLDSLLSRMHGHLSKGQFVVVYAVGVQVQPHCIWVLSKLESDLREVAKARWGTPPDLINIRGIQYETLSTSMRAISGRSSIFRLALSLYDSLDVPVQPYYNRKSHLPIIQSESIGVIHPSFTLSPINHLARNNTRFQLQWKAESFNLTDTGLLLNVAYHVAQVPGEITFMSIMDEKAQGYFVDGWRRTGEVKMELEHIWKQVQKYAAQARILWRIVICKRSQMQMDEVKMWSSLLTRPSEFLRAIDITLACLDQMTPMTLVLPRQSRNDVVDVPHTSQKRPAKEADDKTAHYIDARQVDYAVYPNFRIAMLQDENIDIDGEQILLPLQSSVTVSFSDRYNGSVAASVCEVDKAWSQTAPRHFWLHLLQVFKAPYNTYQETLTLHDRTEIITRSFHQLTFIGRERFMLNDNLPWHLSIMAIANRARLLF